MPTTNQKLEKWTLRKMHLGTTMGLVGHSVIFVAEIMSLILSAILLKIVLTSPGIGDAAQFGMVFFSSIAVLGIVFSTVYAITALILISKIAKYKMMLSKPEKFRKEMLSIKTISIVWLIFGVFLIVYNLSFGLILLTGVVENIQEVTRVPLAEYLVFTITAFLSFGSAIVLVIGWSFMVGAINHETSILIHDNKTFK